MKLLNKYILEKLKVNSKSKVYKYWPKDENELKDIISKRLEEDKNANLNDIDVSNISKMKYLFSQLDPHNIDISKWDMSNITSTRCMFFDCDNFDADLSEWDVSNVEDMTGMFFGCQDFKGKGLEKWNVKITDPDRMYNIFSECKNLKYNKPSWYKE